MFYNVFDYSAKGDCITNNTQTIKVAIEDAAKNGG